MSEKKRFEWIDKDTISDNQTDEWYCFLFDDIRDDFVDLLNDQQDEIQQLKEKLQISEGSLALLMDMILLGDADELIKRAKECARQFAEQFDELIKEELEDVIKENPRLRELIVDE